MTAPTLNTEKDIVRNLRKIRDEISLEIKDMSFEQEREYLDKLLAGKDKDHISSQPANIANDNLGNK